VDKTTSVARDKEKHYERVRYVEVYELLGPIDRKGFPLNPTKRRSSPTMVQPRHSSYHKLFKDALF
jgi:hypothetical protein